MLDQHRKDVAYLRLCQLGESLAGIADRYERIIWAVEVRLWLRSLAGDDLTARERAVVEDAKTAPES